MENYNLDKLIDISVSDSGISEKYKFKKSKKFFGITFRKEGIYENLEFCSNLEDFEKNHKSYFILKPDLNKIPNLSGSTSTLNSTIPLVFYKAKAKLTFQDNIQVSCYFDDIDKAVCFSNKIKEKTGIWITF